MSRGKMPKYTNADKAKWVTLYSQGLSLQDIANKYNCTREYVRQVTSKIVGYPIGTTKRRVQELVSRDTKVQIVIKEMNKIIDGLNQEIRQVKLKYYVLKKRYAERTNLTSEQIETAIEGMIQNG